MGVIVIIFITNKSFQQHCNGVSNVLFIHITQKSSQNTELHNALLLPTNWS